MRPLRTRQRARTRGCLSLALGQMDLHLLVSEHLHASPAMGPSAPVSPEQGSGPNLERVEQQTDPAGLCRLVAVPLTLLAQ